MYVHTQLFTWASTYFTHVQVASLRPTLIAYSRRRVMTYFSCWHLSRLPSFPLAVGMSTAASLPYLLPPTYLRTLYNLYTGHQTKESTHSAFARITSRVQPHLSWRHLPATVPPVICNSSLK